MSKTIDREGVVHFGDARLCVWEEGISAARAAGGIKGADAWESAFKRQVFARIVQTMNRLGWTCTMPKIDEHTVKHYGGNVARWSAERKRFCTKGDLKADLEISGRSITLQMFQSVNTPTRSDHDGRYERDKAACMPYVLRLEMERTRRRIRDYLCNVFSGYTFKPEDPVMGLMGVTAVEMAAHKRRTSGHYRPELDRAEISMSSNAIARDGGTIEHGGQVWGIDYTGRVITGTAYYDLNGAWQIVTGRYGMTRLFHNEIFTQCPPNPRVKRNQRERRKRLELLMQDAVKAMDFDRAKVLKSILFPTGQLYAIWSKRHSCYFDVMYCGYRNALTDAGKYTRDELKPYLGNNLETDDYKAVPVTA
jgi:hypothetical protein